MFESAMPSGEGETCRSLLIEVIPLSPQLSGLDDGFCVMIGTADVDVGAIGKTVGVVLGIREEAGFS